jgi:hypothetical protein
MHSLSMKAIPPPEEAVAETHQEGADRSMTKPPHHHLCMVGLGLDMDRCPEVPCLF